MNREETDALLIAQINAIYDASKRCQDADFLSRMAGTMALAYDTLRCKRDAIAAICGELDLLQATFNRPDIAPFELICITKATAELSDALTWT